MRARGCGGSRRFFRGSDFGLVALMASQCPDWKERIQAASSRVGGELELLERTFGGPVAVPEYPLPLEWGSADGRALRYLTRNSGRP